MCFSIKHFARNHIEGLRAKPTRGGNQQPSFTPSHYLEAVHKSNLTEIELKLLNHLKRIIQWIRASPIAIPDSLHFTFRG